MIVLTSSKDMAILAQLSARYSTQKDPRVELDFKQRGNAQFKLKDYIQAVALYSKVHLDTTNLVPTSEPTATGRDIADPWIHPREG
eukprot:g33157.t1